MPLINIKTDLKSLKFGRDRRGGGSSKQPYVKSSINQEPGNTGGTDFLLRANTLERVGKDVSRLSQFLLGSQEGIRFSLKQNLLSRIGVKTQASGFINEGIYLPTSTLAQIAVNPFGGHLNKMGVNPFINTQTLQTKTGNHVLDGVLGFNPLGIPAYVKNLKEIRGDGDIKSNRLIQLVDSKIYKISNNDEFDGNFFSKVNPFTNKIKDITNALFKSPSGVSRYKQEILRYGGGPGSILGVGQTAIKRYSPETLKKGSNKLGSPLYPKDNYYTLNAGEYPKKEGILIGKDFRKILIEKYKLNEKSPNQNILSKTIDYTDPTKRIEKRVNLGDPGRRDKNVINYQDGLGEALDKLNALPLYKSDNVISNTVKNDLVKFRIGVIDNDNPLKKTYIHFRAFIDSFSDSYTSEWNGEKYMGRGENFYRYKGFDRSISLSWTVVAQSKEELIPMYKKLNYLASSLAPDYSKWGYMRGNLISLTIGGYLYEQTGILKSITYTIPEESPWEIALPLPDQETFVKNQEIPTDIKVKELPHIIKVTGFEFIPIHSFVPAIQKENDGPEQYIALSNESGKSHYGGEISRTQTYKNLEALGSKHPKPFGNSDSVFNSTSPTELEQSQGTSAA